MPQGLAVDLDVLTAELGEYLGYGRTQIGMTDRQFAAVTDSILGGQRQAYWPPVLPGETESYSWSFLRPVATVPFASGARVVPLPDDFGGIEGPLLLVGSDHRPLVIPLSAEARVWSRESPTETGSPRAADLEPLKGTLGDRGQRHQLVMHPLADADYTLQLRYYVNPDAVTAERPFPWGGTQHGEMFIYSCLAAAESRRDDRRGPKWEGFMERLQASISIDRRMKPQRFGYNGDPGEFGYFDRRDRYGWGRRVNTVNGVEPS